MKIQYLLGQSVHWSPFEVFAHHLIAKSRFCALLDTRRKLKRAKAKIAALGVLLRRILEGVERACCEILNRNSKCFVYILFARSSISIVQHA